MRTLLIGFLLSAATDVLAGLLLHWMTDERTPAAPIPYCWSPIAPGQPQAAVDQAQK